LKKFKNINRIRQAAIYFEKYGHYTTFLPGTKDYYDHWDKERKRCLYGYTVGDLNVTGFHYFYLNYCPIDRAVDEELPDGTIQSKRERTFPRFYDGDWEYFQEIDKARKDNKHMIVLKARRKGYSYKAGSMLARNYFFVRNSKNFVFASQKEYLIGDGLLSKAWDFLSFIDDNTAWAQPRLRDREMNKMSGYKKKINGIEIEMGMKSQIMGVSLKDAPDKVRGKAGELVFFEEAGSFPGLLKAWEVTMPTMRQGAKTLGLMIAFGTGGTEGADFEAMEEIFYNPAAYDCMEYENVWDKGAFGTVCGYFIPIQRNLDGFIDEQGNSLEESAIEYEEEMRNKKKGAADAKSLDQYIAEHPFSPQEATLQVTANLFDVASLQEQYNKIKVHGLHSMGTVGELYYSKNNIVKFRPNPSLKSVIRFPHRREDNNIGAVVIYESPYKNEKQQVPYNLYIICHDPYGQSQAADSSSLGASYVLKRPNNVSRPDDIIVASYVGRPNSSDEYNKNIFMLADYYGCKIGFENDRGEVIAYAKRHRKLHKLQEEFEMLDKRELQSKKVKRQYGMHMTEQRKRQGEIYIRDWLITSRGSGSEDTLLNLHKIYDPALLQELIKFNHVGNFDRVMALMIGMYHTRELYNAEVKDILEDRASDKWFDKNYY
jgi:hypothetical protein